MDNSFKKPITRVEATIGLRASVKKMTLDTIPEGGLFLVEGENRNNIAAKGKDGAAYLLFHPQVIFHPDPTKEFQMLFVDTEKCSVFRGEASDKVNFDLGGFC